MNNQEPVNGMMTRDEWMAWLEESWAEAQEPIAWMVYTLDGTSVCVTDNPADFTENHRAFPLYTAPSAREWIGLTDEEISAVDWKPNETLHDYARHIELKLRGKNT